MLGTTVVGDFVDVMMSSICTLCVPVMGYACMHTLYPIGVCILGIRKGSGNDFQRKDATILHAY